MLALALTYTPNELALVKSEGFMGDVLSHLDLK